MKIIHSFPILLACSVGVSCEHAEDRSATESQPEKTVEQGYAEIDGGQLYYEVQGSGEPVVLIHANMMDLRSWEQQVEAFSEYFRVIRYDVRGFGRSSLPLDGQGYSHHDDLAALLTHLEIRSAHVIGLSVGAGIALDFVIEYPSKSRSLVAADPWVAGFAAPSTADLFASVREAGVVLDEAGPAEATEVLLTAPYYAESVRDPEVIQRLREIIGSGYTFWHFSNADPVRTLNPPTLDRITEISVPTLVIVAEREFVPCREIAAILQQRIPGVRSVEISNAGHMSNMENPQEFNRAVVDFLGTVSGRARGGE